MEIPEDVMLEAHDAYVKARELARGGPAKAGEVIWHPIAVAILAERERACERVMLMNSRYGVLVMRSEAVEAIRGS